MSILRLSLHTPENHCFPYAAISLLLTSLRMHSYYLLITIYFSNSANLLTKYAKTPINQQT